MMIAPLPLPWLEVAILIAVAGAVCVSPMRDPIRAWGWGLAFTGAVLVCTVMACLGFYLGSSDPQSANQSVQHHFFGGQALGVDDLNAPLFPLIGILHFLTALATGRTKMRRFSLSWSLASEGIRLAIFGCQHASLLVGLLILGTVPAYVELRNRGRSTRIYVLHMALFASLLLLGWSFVNPTFDHQGQSALGTVPLLAALLIRCGTVPFHGWVTDWFKNASLGNALLFVTPLPGVYAVIRLVLPIAQDWMLLSLGVFSLVTAVYASCMAVVQQEARRFFAYLFLSHASMVLVGLELHTPISLTGALALWISVALSLTGFGLTIRALEARFGHLSLNRYHGLYDQSPALAVCFLVTGLASVGFPGTLGFVAAELLVDGALETNLYLGLALALAAALNGVAVLMAYFRLFTGARHRSTISLALGFRERIAVLTLVALLLGGGMIPQPGIATRFHAAMGILEERSMRMPAEPYPVAGQAGVGVYSDLK